MTNQTIRTYQIVDANNTPIETLINNVAANGVVSANGGSTLTGGLNFINTSSVTVNVSSGISGNVNVAFTSSGGGNGGGSLGNVSVNSGSLLTAQTGINFINTISTQITVSPGIGPNANIGVNSIVKLIVPLSDLATPINQYTGFPGTLAYIRAPRSFTITGARASLFSSGTGNTQVQIQINGLNVFSTLLQVDSLGQSSVPSVAPAVLTANTAVTDDFILSYVCTTAGNGTGLIVTLYGI